MVNAAKQIWQAHQNNPTTLKRLRETIKGPEFEVPGRYDDAKMLGELINAVPLSRSSGNKPLSPLRVAILSTKTGTRHHVDNPMRVFAKAVKRASSADVIIAPEWFFVPPKKGFYSLHELNHFIDRLTSISTGSKQLLVPGSIAWVDKRGRYHNTSLAISNGRVLKRYDKRHDGDDKDFAAKHGRAWHPGLTNSLFKWRGRTVSLEICRDHGDALARWDMYHKGLSALDLQLVVSSGVWAMNLGVAEGGTVVVAQGDGILPNDVLQRKVSGHKTRTEYQEHHPQITARLSKRVKLMEYTTE